MPPQPIENQSVRGYTDISENKMSESVDGKTSSILLFTAIAVAAFFIYPHAKFFDVGVYPYLKYLDVTYLSGGLAGYADSESADTTYAFRYHAIAGEQKVVMPETVFWEVPFTSQAPFGNWLQPWQDACEETSVLMAVAWARGAELSKEFAAEEILQQVQFEERFFGYHRDTNLKDTARLLKDFYRYDNFDLRYDGVTLDNIKKEIADGNLVIVPLAGELLENPYFVSPPHYHMVVIRGYDDRTREFIVNEPGTKYGNAFRYRYDNLMASIHDWTGSAATIVDGEKAMIVVRPVKNSALRYSGA